MIQRDFITRQIHQLIQVLAVVLFNKRNQHFEEAGQLVEHTLRDLFALEPAQIASLPEEDLLALCHHGEALNTEMCLALADLLLAYAELADEGLVEHILQKTLLLYRTVQETPGAVHPIDLGERIQTVESLMNPA